MTFHDLFGLHDPDLKASHWDEDRFVTTCRLCDQLMVKPPGQAWVIAKARR